VKLQGSLSGAGEKWREQGTLSKKKKGTEAERRCLRLPFYLVGEGKASPAGPYKEEHAASLGLTGGNRTRASLFLASFPEGGKTGNGKGSHDSCTWLPLGEKKREEGGVVTEKKGERKTPTDAY